MKLIKINEEHYIIVDDSEIKEGDFVYDTITNTIWTWEKYNEDEIDSKYSGKVFKITHSTQPLEKFTYDNLSHEVFSMDYHNIKPISLQEVKELKMI